MEVSVDQVKILRAQTGAGIMDCKKALEDSEGDVGKAEELLRQWGMVKAQKRAGQETGEGIVKAYIHSGSRIGALVEINCQTDFVAKTAEFKELAHDLAMQIAAMAPEYIDRSEMKEGDARDPEQVCLLQQPFIKDPGKVVQDLITELVVRVGENIRVRRFSYFALGG